MVGAVFLLLGKCCLCCCCCVVFVVVVVNNTGSGVGVPFNVTSHPTGCRDASIIANLAVAVSCLLACLLTKTVMSGIRVDEWFASRGG
jgi:hypothetical protein